MLKFYLLFGLILLQVSMISAQALILEDRGSKKPISSVAVFSVDRHISALSDENGVVVLDAFGESEMLIFQHPSYVELILPKARLIQEVVLYLDKKTYSLNPVTISANRWEQNIDEVPVTISSVTKAEIELENPQTSADLLESVNGVYIQKSQLGGGSPILRGLSANKVLLVVDGVRMNNAIFRGGNLQNVINIDPNSIESTEVVFGPGSVIYGSDALGGVMDFHTINPVLTESDTLNFSSDALVRYASVNSEKTFNFDISLGWKRVGSYTNVTFGDFSDLRQGKNGPSAYERNWYVVPNGPTGDSVHQNSNNSLQRFSGYRQMNILQKIIYKPSDELSFNYGFHYSTTTDIPRYDRIIQLKDSLPKYGEWYYGPQMWMMHALRMDLVKPTKLYDEVQVIAAYQRFEESRHSRKFKQDGRTDRFESVNVVTLNADFNKELIRDLSLFYGVEGVYNGVNSTAEIRSNGDQDVAPASTRYPDGGSSYSSAAAYVTSRWSIAKRTSLSAGARYSYVYLNSKFDDTTFFQFPYEEINLNNSAVTGSFGLVTYPIKPLKLSTNLSSGFRAPNLDDVAKVFDSEPGNVVVPNQNLKPELSYNIDLSMTYSFDTLSRVGITGFYTWLQDVIIRSDYLFDGKDSIYYDGTMSKVQAMTNGGNGYIYGANLFARAAVSQNFALRTELSYQYGRDGNGDPLRHVTPVFGTTAIEFFWKGLIAQVYCNYNGEKSYSQMPSSEIDKAYMYAEDANGNPYSPSWWTLNFKASYRVVEDVTIDAGVENILNKRYRPFAWGISAPGVNVILAIRVNM